MPTNWKIQSLRKSSLSGFGIDELDAFLIEHLALDCSAGTGQFINASSCMRQFGSIYLSLDIIDASVSISPLFVDTCKWHISSCLMNLIARLSLITSVGVASSSALSQWYSQNIHQFSCLWEVAWEKIYGWHGRQQKLIYESSSFILVIVYTQTLSSHQVCPVRYLRKWML